MKNGNKVEIIDLNDFLSSGILKEKDFKEKIETINWEKYSDKKVLIKGCAAVPIPTWAYMMLTAKLTLFAKQVLYGELCSAYLIFNKN
jgi:hypothetical protein|tara:strand:- start:81 stop:344 length:264 start_codon:yes stop_codon:yes gene_type:complete